MSKTTFCEGLACLCEEFIKEMALQILVLHLHERILKKRIKFVYDASDIDPNDDDSDEDMALGEATSGTIHR